MVSINIDLPENVVNAAKQEGISLEDFVRDCISARLAGPKKKDAFLDDDAVFDGSTPPDLSQNHDEYLYGDKA